MISIRISFFDSLRQHNLKSTNNCQNTKFDIFRQILLVLPSKCGTSPKIDSFKVEKQRPKVAKTRLFSMQIYCLFDIICAKILLQKINNQGATRIWKNRGCWLRTATANSEINV